jgi:hypothetical protein
LQALAFSRKTRFRLTGRGSRRKERTSSVPFPVPAQVFKSQSEAPKISFWVPPARQQISHQRLDPFSYLLEKAGKKSGVPLYARQGNPVSAFLFPDLV